MSWRTARIGDVAIINPPPGRPIGADESFAFLPMAAVSEHCADVRPRENRAGAELKAGFTYFEDGDLLVAKITPCFENGKIALARTNLPGFASSEFHVLRASPTRVDSRYLTHFLRQPWIRELGKRRMTGSAGQQRVPRSFLEQLEIPLPPLPEQRRIAAILDAADVLRAKRRAALAKLDTLVQSIFAEMFGDPRANPKKWPTVELSELIVDGPQNGLYKPSSDYGTGTLILRIDAFYDGAITKLDSLKRVRLSEGEIETYALSPGDIVINRVNSREFLGKSAIVPELSEPVVFESNMMRFRVDRQKALPEFIIQFLQTKFIRSQIAVNTKDAVNQSSINQKDVRSFAIRLPPPTEQSRFVRATEKILPLSESMASGLAAANALFASLQHRAFSGGL